MSSRVNSIFLTIIASFVAVVTGLILVFFPKLIWVALIGFVAYVLILLKFNVVGILLYEILALLSPDLKISDSLFLLTVPLLFLSNLNPKVNSVKFKGGAGVGLYVYFFMLFLSLLLGVLVFKHDKGFVYNDFRSLFYYSWIFIFVWIHNRNNNLNPETLNKVVLGIAVFIAIVAIVQYVTGFQFIMQGKVASLDTEGANQSFITRVQFPGFVFLIYLITYSISKIWNEKGSKLFWLVLIAVSLVAEYVNFGRALWIWTFISIVLLTFFNTKRILYFSVLVLSLSLGAVSLYFVSPDKFNTIQTRILSVSKEGGAKTSYGWRKLENESAIKAIEGSPLYGVAIGGEYRAWVYDLRLFKDHTRYTHNSYMFLGIKLGLIGLIALLILIISTWIKALKLLKTNKTKPTNLSAYRAVLCFLPAILGISATQPELVNYHSVFLVACLISIVLMSELTQDDFSKEAVS